jgi:hypothetical protein
MTKTKTLLIVGLLALAVTGSTFSAAQARPWGHHHHHHGGVFVAGALGALALGAIGAHASDNCYIEHRPVTDAWGNVMYVRNVPVCD